MKLVKHIQPDSDPRWSWALVWDERDPSRTRVAVRCRRNQASEERALRFAVVSFWNSYGRPAA